MGRIYDGSIIMNNLLDKYLFQAVDAYPYNLQETLESLQYALSYNPKSTKALCLTELVYVEQLHDYETAKNYRVQNIEGLVAKLKANKVTIVDEIKTYDYGKFVHIMDEEGTKIELWEP